MNEFERKLSQQPFRTPPPDLREAILREASKNALRASWTWRDWFWPAPQAWAALAAVWVCFAAVSLFPTEAASHPTAVQNRALPNAGALLTFHQARDLNYVLELSN